MPPVTLLQLPREIRDSIYYYAIFFNEDQIPMPPLLLVNHQISAEAAVSYYGNTIWVGRPPELVIFLGRLFLGENGSGPNQIKAVKVEPISDIEDEAWLPQLFRSLSCLSGLRSVTFMMSADNLTAAQTKLAGTGLELLKGRVEVIIDNQSFYTEYLDEASKLFIREGIGRRAADAMDWVNEEEKVTEIT